MLVREVPRNVLALNCFDGRTKRIGWWLGAEKKEVMPRQAEQNCLVQWLVTVPQQNPAS